MTNILSLDDVNFFYNHINLNYLLSFLSKMKVEYSGTLAYKKLTNDKSQILCDVFMFGDDESSVKSVIWFPAHDDEEHFRIFWHTHPNASAQPSKEDMKIFININKHMQNIKSRERNIKHACVIFGVEDISITYFGENNNSILLLYKYNNVLNKLELYNEHGTKK